MNRSGIMSSDNFLLDNRQGKYIYNCVLFITIFMRFICIVRFI